ncbi:MAG TPA: hypothetical protein VNO32_29050 [Candidatus Acidoferrum sp.]|nr:hypothetical protein [Candidatus Acidoferrum sp.]
MNQTKPTRNPTIDHQDLPSELRKGLTKPIENIEQMWVDLFHKESCDPLPGFTFSQTWHCTHFPSDLERVGKPSGVTIK